MSTDCYVTRGGIAVRRTIEDVPIRNAIEPVVSALDERRGALLASSYEYPGRYTRWDLGFVDPPLALTARGRRFRADALNERGRVLLPALAHALSNLGAVAALEARDDGLEGEVRAAGGRFPEEERSRQPSVFSVLRALVDLFFHDGEPHLGLYGAFGYDLAFQFEPIRLRLERSPAQRDLVLYLPDELIVVDHRREVAQRRQLRVRGRRPEHRRPSPRGLDTSVFGRRRGAARGRPRARATTRRWSRSRARPSSAAISSRWCPARPSSPPARGRPSEIFRRLREWNPSPYGFLINLGDAEYLVGASPEMYVRVDGDRVETCPISGTIARGRDPIGDAAQILALLDIGQGRVRADHVHRRRPQRQVAHLRAGQRARDRPPSDRDVLAAHPHRRPRRGSPAAGLRRARRLPRPRVGGHRHRRAQGVGHAVHRGPRALAARVVRRRRRPARLRRQPQHRPHPAHRAREGRRCRGARRRDAPLRLRSRRRGARDPPQGLRLPRRHPAAAADDGDARPSSRPSPAEANASCSSTTRTRSSTRSPTTSARPAPR